MTVGGGGKFDATELEQHKMQDWGSGVISKNFNKGALGAMS